MRDYIPSPDEFVQLAGTAKVELMERLGGVMLKKSYDLAEAAFQHYRLQATAKGTPEAGEAQAVKAQLDWEYDGLKHAVSLLQSTRRAERELSE